MPAAVGTGRGLEGGAITPAQSARRSASRPRYRCGNPVSRRVRQPLLPVPASECQSVRKLSETTKNVGEPRRRRLMMTPAATILCLPPCCETAQRFLRNPFCNIFGIRALAPPRGDRKLWAARATAKRIFAAGRPGVMKYSTTMRRPPAQVPTSCHKVSTKFPQSSHKVSTSCKGAFLSSVAKSCC